MSKDTCNRILVTGANGYLGTAIVLSALDSGYQVRAVVRRQDAKHDVLASHNLQQAEQAGQLDFAIVPDYKIQGALVSAAAGCSAIIHTAAPLIVPGDLRPETLGGLQAALDAAEANKSIKRLVHTQSILAICSFEDMLPSSSSSLAAVGGQMDAVPVRTAQDILPPQAASEDDHPIMQRYSAAKVAVRNAVSEYASRNPSRHFSIVNILPGYIIGPDLRAKVKSDMYKSSNGLLGFLWKHYPPNVYYGLPEDGPPAPLCGMAVDVRDCADAHVRALDTDKMPGALLNFLLCTEQPHGVKWGDAERIVREKLPDIAVRIPFASTQETIPAHFRDEGVELTLLSRPMRSYEQSVVDTIKWWDGLEDDA